MGLKVAKAVGKLMNAKRLEAEPTRLKDDAAAEPPTTPNPSAPPEAASGADAVVPTVESVMQASELVSPEKADAVLPNGDPSPRAAEPHASSVRGDGVRDAETVTAPAEPPTKAGVPPHSAQAAVGPLVAGNVATANELQEIIAAEPEHTSAPAVATRRTQLAPSLPARQVSDKARVRRGRPPISSSTRKAPARGEFVTGTLLLSHADWKNFMRAVNRFWQEADLGEAPIRNTSVILTALEDLFASFDPKRPPEDLFDRLFADREEKRKSIGYNLPAALRLKINRLLDDLNEAKPAGVHIVRRSHLEALAVREFLPLLLVPKIAPELVNRLRGREDTGD